MSDSTSDCSSEESENVVQSTFLQQLSVAASRANTPFCCAGHVPIGKQPVFERIKEDVADRQSVSPPVVIRWDRADGKNISKLTLPPQSYDEKSEEQHALNGLLDNCIPASFGRGGEDVLDESYCKAAKLDSDQLSTNFNPYDVGIIGAIAQTLLPDIAIPASEGGGGRTLVDNLGVLAELYKVNVRPFLFPTTSLSLISLRQIYSAPSGKFRSHVDTPRGFTQFGSLVVCLPYRHHGGELRIAHGSAACNQSITYNWSDQDAEIKWAAFYSDCQHEVKEVTAGHGITLTYNLYAHEQLGGIFRKP